MPRPDKRFVRYPRRGASEPAGAGDTTTPENPPPTFVKGRHATVPRPAEPSPIAEAAPSPASAHPLPSEQITKYDRRAGGAPVRPSQPAPQALEPHADIDATPEATPAATEVVVDLRESTTGFEAVYWRRPARREDDDTG